MVDRNVYSFIPLLILLLYGAWALHKHSKRMQLRERMHGHLRIILPNTISGLRHGETETSLHRLKVKLSIYLGFAIKPWHLLIAPALLFVIYFAGWFWAGTTGACILLISSLFLFGFMLPYTRWQRRQAAIIAQIPMFIDQVLRALGTGRSVEGAIRLASAEIKLPLRPILDRVLRSTDLGADLPETLSEAAELHKLRELSLIALAIRISNVYGSSPREMLQSVVQMIRQREAARRELAAMTGETRISAWVLGTIPLAIAAYMMWMNPDYMEGVLKDPSSRVILELALGLQATGALIMWRMLKNV